MKAQAKTIAPELLRNMDAYWRAANYLSVGQIYLYDNPLLKHPLTLEHIKPRLLGHWGTSPGLNLIYVHRNRVIKENDLNVLFITGPGHGGPSLVAHAYLEGTYTEVYPNVTQDEAGMKTLFTQFSFPGGIPSHAAPETPGSIHEPEEVHRQLAAVMDAVTAEIRQIWSEARTKGVQGRPAWPMIILRTPKGWTCPAEIDGKKCEDYWRPDVVMACCGDVPTLETLAAVALIRQHLPQVIVRVVNVVNLMKLQPPKDHPHGLPDEEFDAIFTSDRQILFAFHGYPSLIHQFTYSRTNHRNLHVRGYKEEGTTTTPFDMVVLNDMDRFHLVCDVIDRVPGLAAGAADVRRAMVDKRAEHKRYIVLHGEDMPEIDGWTWPGMMTDGVSIQGGGSYNN